MTKKLYEIKKQMIDLLEEEISVRGVRNISVAEVGQVADIIKDLAEAEEKCWKACYYKSVVEAMEASQGGGADRMGYGQPGNTGSSATMGYDSSMGYDYAGTMGYTAQRPMRMGYDPGAVDNIRAMMMNADPERKEQLKRDLRKLMQEAGM